MLEICESKPGVYGKFLDHASMIQCLRRHGFKPPDDLSDSELLRARAILKEESAEEKKIVEEDSNVYPCFVETRALELVEEEIAKRKIKLN